MRYRIILYQTSPRQSCSWGCAEPRRHASASATRRHQWEIHKFRLSIAVGNYDRIRPLVDGDVQIDSVDPVFMLDPEEIFFRAFGTRTTTFELSLSSYSVKTAAGTSPYIAIPVFPCVLSGTSIYVRADRGIDRPGRSEGKRIGVPEQPRQCVGRMLLEEEYSVKASDVVWVRGGYEDPARVENQPDCRTSSSKRTRGTISACWPRGR